MDRSAFACPSCGLNGERSTSYDSYCTDCGDLMQPVNGPWREDKLWVLDAKCTTCIFRPGNKMHLREDRVATMVAACIAENTIIPCHQTLDGPRSVCRGLWDVHRDEIPILRLAEAMDVLAFDSPPQEH